MICQRHWPPICRHSQQCPLPAVIDASFWFCFSCCCCCCCCSAPPLAEKSFKRTHQLCAVPSTEYGERTTDGELWTAANGWFQSGFPDRNTTGERTKVFPEGKKALRRPDWARLAWRCYPPAGMDETARRTPTLLLQLSQCGQVGKLRGKWMMMAWIGELHGLLILPINMTGSTALTGSIGSEIAQSRKPNPPSIHPFPLPPPNKAFQTASFHSSFSFQVALSLFHIGLHFLSLSSDGD